MYGTFRPTSDMIRHRQRVGRWQISLWPKVQTTSYNIFKITGSDDRVAISSWSQALTSYNIFMITGPDQLQYLHDHGIWRVCPVCSLFTNLTSRSKGGLIAWTQVRMSVLSGRFVLASRGNSASVDGVFVHKRNSYIYIRQEHEREREREWIEGCFFLRHFLEQRSW